MSSSVTGGADALSDTSRQFYEWTKVKLVASIALGGYCLLLLGWCCQTGGLASQDNNYIASSQAAHADSLVLDAYSSSASGYGFACFFYLMGFIAATAASVYISPVFAGTSLEKAMLSRPQEIESVNV